MATSLECFNSLQHQQFSLNSSQPSAHNARKCLLRCVLRLHQGIDLLACCRHLGMRGAEFGTQCLRVLLRPSQRSCCSGSVGVCSHYRRFESLHTRECFT
jgi:hypothetical protein